MPETPASSNLPPTSAATLFYQQVVQELTGLKKEKNRTGFLAAAEAYLKQASEQKNEPLQMYLNLQLCVHHNHFTSRFELSNQYALRCLELARHLADITTEANALRMMGVNYNFLGELTRANETYNEGIRILELKQPKTTEDKEILAGLYFNVVTLHKESEMDEAKLRYIDKAFQLFTEIENRQGIARTYISYANYYPGITGTDKAIEYYQMAAEIFKEIDDKRGYGNCLVNIGYQQALRLQLEQGIPLIQQGIDLLKESGNMIFVTNGYYFLATAYRLNKQYQQAIGLLREIERIINESESKLNFSVLYEEWALTLEEMGDIPAALAMYKKHQREKENIIKFTKTAAINDARMNFELEEKRKEAEYLKRKNEEIEEYVRKVEISNNELKQFAHVASHDLKEPLRMVTLYMQMLEKNAAHKLNEDELQYLYYAKEGANRMYNLINSLLSLSKINPDVKRETVDLNKVLAEVAEFLRPEMEQANFRLSTVVLPKVKGNKVYLYQLFQNLLTNAIKYNTSPKPTLEISCMKSDNNYYFSFLDNGMGIPEKYREKVFEIFQRLHTREQYSGTGIGLTICKKIVEHMNGKIWIESGKNGGSNFRFTIPV
ncbi:MAG: ATP-binding protein [Chitinophagales bacterium]